MTTLRRSEIQDRVLDRVVRENLDLLGEPCVTRPRQRRAKQRLRGVLIMGLAATLAAAAWSVRLVNTGPAPSADPFQRLASPLGHLWQDYLEPPRPLSRELFPFGVETIVLDAGHGGSSHGTELADGLQEKELTLDIARRVRTRLEAMGYRVLLTRNGDHDVTLAERAELANTNEADLLVSIHVNWIPRSEVRGVETFYLGVPRDHNEEQVALRENEQAGYSIADRRKLLDNIYDDLRRADSRHLAERVQAALVDSLGVINPELRDRGVKTAPLVVLAGTQVPSILTEVSCLSNDDDARLLRRPWYRQRIAEALAKGIEGYAREASNPQTAG